MTTENTILDGYEDARANYTGWCPDCEEWTRDGTEPDATEYDCPQCDGHNVVGADVALMGAL
jgi:Zn finger protein HypA/HybF involved in hydrogenase expression